MKKKITIYSLSVLVLVAVGIFTGTYAISQAKELEREKELRETNSKAYITEVFHDPANEYIEPFEPTTEDDITLRLRTERYNVTKAQIQYTSDKGETWQTVDMSFEKHDDTGYFDFWIGTIPAQSKLFYYRFICANETGSYYVDRTLFPDTMEMNTYSDCWSVSPGYSSPEWAKGALWYNLSPDAFYNGDVSGDTATSDSNDINSWNHIRRTLSDKYGGDLKGIAEKTEYINSLYADAVFMNPFNKAYQNAGYGPIYFDQVEPTLGNAQSLQDMMEALHDEGLKVGSDAVLTFTPYDSIYFNNGGKWPLEGASQNEDSEYTDMYVYYDWPDNYHLSWSGPALDHTSEALQELLYTGENSYLKYYTAEPYGFDSWRFDCGGWLYGRTEEGYLNDIDVLAVIKENLQEINPDVFLVSEASSWNSVASGVWGAQWNATLADGGFRDYYSGVSGESRLVSLLKTSLDSFPRPVALSIFNYVTNHDKYRLDDDNVPAYMEKAGNLVLMTYIGSPSIYYGEEINLDREKEDGLGEGDAISFYAMEWDESNWDYERYNLYKSLGELRSEYSALKTGAVRNLVVDDAQNLYAFGRWDNDGTVITVASQNADTIEVEVEARLLSVADGTVFTDWLTGKQYEVDEEGMLHLEVIPGGSVFVTGKKSSQYRDQYTISNLKNADADIYWTNTDTYLLEGEGKLDKSDKVTLATTNLYGAGAIYATAEGDGEVALTVRQDASSKSAAYNVTISGNKLMVTARTKSGGKLQTICEAKYEQGNAVRIHRNGNNTFTVSVAKLTEDGKVSGEWTTVKNSAATVSMEYLAVAGFAPIKGSVTLSNVTTEAYKEEVNFADFEGKAYTAMLDFSDMDNAKLEDGKLTLTAKEKLAWATTQSKDHDWTFKIKLDSSIDKAGNYAGVWCISDENQWVSAGRTVIGGEQVIFIGRTTDGTMQVDSYVKDSHPDKPVIVQLQRIGSMYTVAYSYDDETYALIDDQIFANFSSEHVGAFVAGDASATFDYVSFGDSIHDGKSVNVPYHVGIVDVDYSDAVTANKSEKTMVVSGNWEYGTEGYYQTEEEGTAQLGFATKIYDDFKLNVTLQLEDGEGYAAVGFGKAAHDSEEKDGFLLKYTKDNQLILMKNGVKMASATVKTKNGAESLRIILEVKNSDITVYAGQNATRVMTVKDTGCDKGYICFYSVDTAARFMNSRITSLSASWNILTSKNASRNTVLGGVNRIVVTGSTQNSLDYYGATTLLGVGVTDFVTSLEIKLGSTREAGVLLCASEGASKASNGISVALQKGGKLVLQADGEIKGEYALGEDVKKATIMVVKKDRVCQVYLQGIEEPVITYEDSYERGGAYQLYTTNAGATFTGFGLEDIHNVDYQSSQLYQLWKNNKLYSLDVETYRENFNNLSGWESLTKYHTDHGSWDIVDGALSCTAAPNWASGVTIYDRLFKDFSMEFKYRFDDASNNFAGVLFYKPGIDDTNNSAKYSLLLYSSGDVNLYEASTQKFVGTARIKNFEIGKWYDLKMVCSGNSIKVYNGNECLMSYTNSELNAAEGFLSFTSNKSLVSFDDVLIEPIE